MINRGKSRVGKNFFCGSCNYKRWCNRQFLIFAILVLCTVTTVVVMVAMAPRYVNEIQLIEAATAPTDRGLPLPSRLTIGMICAVTTRKSLTSNFDLSVALEYLRNFILTSAESCDQRVVNKNSYCYLYKIPIFVDLLPSFCRTASPGFSYRFYVSYDFDDPILSKGEGRNSFETIYSKIIKEHCRQLKKDPELKLLVSNSSGQPAKAQNDAVMTAYLEKVDYYYRVNDDTTLETSNWSEAFVRHLLNSVPTNLGVVGPTCQKSRFKVNSKILTYEFLHRTHVDIFGYHYPPVFTNWWADDWITHVYQPGRSLRLSDVTVYHTWSRGHRYVEDSGALTTLDNEIAKGRLLVEAAVQKLAAKR